MNFKMKKVLFTFSIFLGVALAATGVVFADSATSTNYKVFTGDSASKGFSSSTSYNLYSSTGQAGPTGQATSTSYKLQAGFIRRLVSPPPTLRLIDPDINNDGVVSVPIDILGCAQSFGTPATNPNYNSNCDMNADGVVNIPNDILVVASFFGPGKWPPINSQTQPLSWTLGKKGILYVTAPPDAQSMMPILNVSCTPSAACSTALTSFTQDEFLGKKRGHWEWIPNTVGNYTVVFSATYADGTSTQTLYINVPQL